MNKYVSAPYTLWCSDIHSNMLMRLHKAFQQQWISCPHCAISCRARTVRVCIMCTDLCLSDVTSSRAAGGHIGLHDEWIRIDSRRQQSGHLNGKSIPGYWGICLHINKPLALCLCLPLFIFLPFSQQYCFYLFPVWAALILFHSAWNSTFNSPHLQTTQASGWDAHESEITS